MNWQKMNNFIISGSINKALVERLAKRICDLNNDKPLHVIMCSQGGHEYCGRAIAGMLRVASQQRKVIVSGYGDVHSAAVLVFAAGDERLLSKYASVMVHQSTDEITGTTKEIVAHAMEMEAGELKWCRALADLTGTDVDTWVQLHEDDDKYLTPPECLELKLATRII